MASTAFISYPDKTDDEISCDTGTMKKRLTGKVWGLSKKLSDLGKESNRAKILLQ